MKQITVFLILIFCFQLSISQVDYRKNDSIIFDSLMKSIKAKNNLDKTTGDEAIDISPEEVPNCKRMGAADPWDTPLNVTTTLFAVAGIPAKLTEYVPDEMEVLSCVEPAEIVIAPAPLLMVTPGPGVNVVRVKPPPLPMSTCPLEGVVVNPVPPPEVLRIPALLRKSANMLR